MNDEILFLSDLHLSAARPGTVEVFLRFLAGRAVGARILYVLGDLFDAYIGDDDLGFPNGEIGSAFKTLTAKGTAVYFQHGNRDFLLGVDFAQRAGVALLPDYAVIDLYDVPTLVTHGDLLCTDDVQYQTARTRIRTPEWRQSALRKPLFLRRWYARWYRYQSGRDKSGKTAEIMDVNAGAVIDTMRRHGVTRLIHGHTHRPAVHEFAFGDQTGQRFVLPEWRDHGAILVWTPAGHRHEDVG